MIKSIYGLARRREDVNNAQAVSVASCAVQLMSAPLAAAGAAALSRWPGRGVGWWIFFPALVVFVGAFVVSFVFGSIGNIQGIKNGRMGRGLQLPLAFYGIALSLIVVTAVHRIVRRDKQPPQR
jgi:ABC-type Fe3+ transport system permease subunit